MSFNSFGHSFRFTTWGESHGPAIGVVVDGVPPCVPLDERQVLRNDLIGDEAGVNLWAARLATALRACPDVRA